MVEILECPVCRRQYDPKTGTYITPSVEERQKQRVEEIRYGANYSCIKEAECSSCRDIISSAIVSTYPPRQGPSSGVEKTIST